MAIGTAQNQNDSESSKFGLKVLSRPHIGTKANLPINLKKLVHVKDINVIDPSVSIGTGVPIPGGMSDGYLTYLGPKQFRIKECRLIYKLQGNVDFGNLPADRLAGLFGWVTVPDDEDIQNIINTADIGAFFALGSIKSCALKYQNLSLNENYIEAVVEGVRPLNVGTRDLIFFVVYRVADNMFNPTPPAALFDFIVLGEELPGVEVNRRQDIF